MKISVIIPIFNVERFIRECLESVAAQTCTASGTELEAVLVEDCSTDGTKEIVRGFLEQYIGPVKFKVVEHEAHMGVSAARNTGIRNSSGDYIYFLDSDDMIKADCLEKMSAYIVAHPDCEIVFAGADTLPLNENFKWLDVTNKDLPDYCANPTWIKANILHRFSLPMTCWNRLMQREFIVGRQLYFDENLAYREDELWNFFVAKYASRIAVCKENTYIYRFRQGSLTQSETTLQREKMVLAACTEMRDNIAPFQAGEQAKMIWQVMLPVYNGGMSEEGRRKADELLLSLNPYLRWTERCVMDIYVKQHDLFEFLLHIPKVKGAIKRSMTICNCISAK